MIKRTLYFGNPAWLGAENEQMTIHVPATDESPEKKVTVPIEDIAVVISDHYQVSITHHLMHKLLENNAALITCDDRHMPTGLMLNLNGNSIQQERFANQIEASLPLKKQLWAQTIETKIRNQASVLKIRSVTIENMMHWADSVKSGDSENHEARAAAYYWQNMFPSIPHFRRDRGGIPPNNMLNYGYAVLRAITARSLVASGLLPTLGIHHHNRYNAYALADDIMEPYRPFVDIIVAEIADREAAMEEITTELKKELLALPTVDVFINDQKSPLMIAMQQTTASLAACFNGELRRIAYPVL